MIIWGSKGKAVVKGTGYFYCPKCSAKTPYELKSLGKYFTLYFIPLFRTQDIAEYIECTWCKTPYETSILNYDFEKEQAFRDLLRIVKEEIEAGQPLHLIHSALAQNGATNEDANAVLAVATGGQMKQCKECKFVYSSNMSYCSNCGAGLQKIE